MQNGLYGHARSSAWILWLSACCFVGLQTVRVGLSLILLPALETLFLYWVALPSLILRLVSSLIMLWTVNVPAIFWKDMEEWIWMRRGSDRKQYGRGWDLVCIGKKRTKQINEEERRRRRRNKTPERIFNLLISVLNLPVCRYIWIAAKGSFLLTTHTVFMFLLMYLLCQFLFPELPGLLLLQSTIQIFFTNHVQTPKQHLFSEEVLNAC